MTEDKTNVTVFCRPQFAGQPETPEMKEKFQRAMLEYTQTGKLSPDMPDLLVQEEDGNFHSVKETARERISALSQLIAEVSETMPDGVPAAKLRLAVDLLDDLPRLINREKQNGTPV